MVNPAEQEVQLSLDFACCRCGEPMGVTLQCGGQSLNYGKESTNSQLRLRPCPARRADRSINCAFDPTGTLHVRAAAAPADWPVPEPSVN